MKTLLASLFVLVSAVTSVSQAAIDPQEWSFSATCMQTKTNDGFLPNIVTIYEGATGFDKVLLKFYIGNDERTVLATQTGQDPVNMVQFNDVRLFEDGAVKGGHIGIKLNMDIGVFMTGGTMYWHYFDGAKATYSCSRY